MLNLHRDKKNGKSLGDHIQDGNDEGPSAIISDMKNEK